VRLPPEFSGAESKRALRTATPEPWGQSSLIYRLPVGEDGEGTINERTIRYTPQRGLEVLRS
jgi:CRISPR-associated endonuclease/helicase Cas3